MLIDKINDCTLAINELSVLRDTALHLKAFETSVNQLANVGSMVIEYVATVEEMKKHDFCKVDISSDDLNKMQEAIKNCAAAVHEMRLNNNDVSAVVSVFRSQQTILTAFWKSTAMAYVAPICSYLDIIQAFAPNKKEVADLSNFLNSAATANPTAAIVRTLDEQAKKASAITDNFQMSKEVRAFLQKVKNGTATFADINSEVTEWITKHKLGSKMKISFSKTK